MKSYLKNKTKMSLKKNHLNDEIVIEYLVKEWQIGLKEETPVPQRVLKEINQINQDLAVNRQQEVLVIGILVNVWRRGLELERKEKQ